MSTGSLMCSSFTRETVPCYRVGISHAGEKEVTTMFTAAGGYDRPLTDLALEDVERRFRAAEQLEAEADRPHVGDDLTSRVAVLRYRASEFRRTAARDLGAVYAYLAQSPEAC